MPDTEVEATAVKVAKDIAKLPPLAVVSIKEAVLASEDTGLDAGLMLERKAFQLLFASQDKREEMQALFDKRKPDFKGE